jgi:ZIP family zinc transporter
MITEFFQSLTSPVAQGLMGGLFIALCNMAGALLVLVWRRPSPRLLNLGLGLAAGVMLTASFTSLILPGIEFGGMWPVLIGWALGAALLAAADLWIPHLHMFKGREGGSAAGLKAVWLFIIAITLHNMPEGLAVGVSFGSGDLGIALPLMLAIGLQNIPEGFAVAISARNAGMGSTNYAAIAGIRSGLVEIPLALLGAWAVAMVRPLLPYAMGFAAGAMLYVISSEIIPETHRNGQSRVATAGLMLGAMVMLYLDVGLG